MTEIAIKRRRPAGSTQPVAAAERASQPAKIPGLKSSPGPRGAYGAAAPAATLGARRSALVCLRNDGPDPDPRIEKLRLAHQAIFAGVKNCGDVESASYVVAGQTEKIRDIHEAVYRNTKNCGTNAATILVLHHLHDKRPIDSIRADYKAIFDGTKNCGDVASAILVGLAAKLPLDTVRTTFTRIFTAVRKCGDIAAAMLTKLVLENGIDEKLVNQTYRAVYDNSGRSCGDIASATLVREALAHNTPVDKLLKAYAALKVGWAYDVTKAMIIVAAERTGQAAAAIAATTRHLDEVVSNCGDIASAVLALDLYPHPDSAPAIEAALGRKEQIEEEARRPPTSKMGTLTIFSGPRHS